MVRDEVKSKLSEFRPKYKAVKDDYLMNEKRLKDTTKLSEVDKRNILEASKAPLNYMKEHFLLLMKFSNGEVITEDDLKRLRSASALADQIYRIAATPSLRKMNQKLSSDDLELLQLMSMVSNNNFANEEFDRRVQKYFFT